MIRLTKRPRFARGLALGLGLSCALAGAAPAARADNAMFTFAEMLELQKLPLESPGRALSEEELILYQNMEFYVFTVFEALHAANNTALALHREPLFCAPAGAFRFRGENEIATMAARISEDLLTLTKEIGASPARYDDQPASEVLLLGLRTTFPCADGSDTLGAMVLDGK